MDWLQDLSWAGWAVLALFFVLVSVIWSMRFRRSPKLKVDCDAPIDDLVPSLAGLSLGTPVHGNRVEVLENGAFFDALLADIAAARHTIHFETFLWKDGELGQRVSKALCERARAGVKVRMLLDAQGARKIGESRDYLREAGVQLKFFHKWSWINIGVLNDRDHRKLCVVDGRVAYVGGHCITDDWLGDAEDHQHFADVSLRLQGPVVNNVQSAFSENWTGQTGEVFLGEHVFPQQEKAGDATIHAAFVKPDGSAAAVKVLHHTVLCVAKKRIWIQNPYFIPEPEAIEAMGAAVKRGVDVRVLVPAVGGSDAPAVQHAGHRNFEKMLRCGVRIWEYPHTLLHQKVMIVDDRWCAVGSTNFDDRSFEINDEITLGVLDRELAVRLEGIFEKYLQRAQEVRLEVWRKRGVWHRLKDHAAYAVNEVL
jgi:cardiolipin synthase